MRKPKTGFILIGITAALCLTMFVYFDKRERNLVNMILRQNHAASDTHDPIFVDKTRNSNIKYSRDENMDDEEKWNDDRSVLLNNYCLRCMVFLLTCTCVFLFKQNHCVFQVFLITKKSLLDYSKCQRT